MAIAEYVDLYTSKVQFITPGAFLANLRITGQKHTDWTVVGVTVEVQQTGEVSTRYALVATDDEGDELDVSVDQVNLDMYDYKLI